MTAFFGSETPVLSGDNFRSETYMNRTTLCCVAAFLIVCGTSAAKAAPTGIWEGVIDDPARPLVVNVDLDKQILKLDGTGTTEWKVEELAKDDAVIRFSVIVRGRKFQFTGSIADGKIIGEMKTPDRSLPFWLEPLPIFSTPGGRVEAWQQDLERVDRFLRYDRSYSEGTRQLVRGRVSQLSSALSQKPDQEIMADLARAVALGGNAHTRLYLVRNRTEVRRLPIRVWWFRRQLRVVRATRENAGLLGCQVVKIGDLSIREAARRVGDINAGNASWQRYMSTYFLTSSDILFGAQIVPTPDEVSFTFRCTGGQRKVRLAPLPLRKSSVPVEAWWDLTPDSRDPNAEFVPALAQDIAPLYLRRTRENYWFQYLPATKLLYFQYNRSYQAAEGPPIAELGDKLISEIAEKKPAALVIDLRFNTGGDLTVGKPLMKKIGDQRGDLPVFVVTGRTTFSAGITHVVQLKEWARAIIVGEPVGDELDIWSEGGNLLMPNSKLTLHYTNAFHSYSKRDHPEYRPYVEDMSVDSVAPDVPVEQSWDDYINGRDPALVAITRYVNKRFVSR